MMRRFAPLLVVLLLFLGAGQLIGCSDPVKPPAKPVPQDPETELTYAPIENDTTTFRVRFYWNGFDRDGEVVRFYFAVDNDSLKPISEWRTTTAKDTTFLFLVDPILEIRGHVFMISAVDDKGGYDKTPARRFFSAKSAPPTSRIDKGPSAYNPLVGPNFTFEWSGIDPDGGETGGKAPVDSFEYQLLLLGSFALPGHPPLPSYDQAVYVNLINQGTGRTLQPPYDDWEWVGIRGLKNRFRNATPGEYVFAERAVDLAGATRVSPLIDMGLSPRGTLVVEVGDGKDAVEATFPRLPFVWLATASSADAVFLLKREDLPGVDGRMQNTA